MQATTWRHLALLSILALSSARADVPAPAPVRVVLQATSASGSEEFELSFTSAKLELDWKDSRGEPVEQTRSRVTFDEDGRAELTVPVCRRTIFGKARVLSQARVIFRQGFALATESPDTVISMVYCPTRRFSGSGEDWRLDAQFQHVAGEVHWEDGGSQDPDLDIWHLTPRPAGSTQSRMPYELPGSGEPREVRIHIRAP